MKVHRAAGVLVVCLLTASRAGSTPPAAQAAAASPVSDDSAPLFRVFLTDGTSLVSFGEMARVDDRVVFSMPTSASTAAPQLQLINIPADRVDWVRTTNYAESIRATRYLSTRAESDYAQLTSEIAQALDDVGQTDDNNRRLQIVERARRTLADWPAAHYNYKRDDIQQMLGTLDEAIASLRASSGSSTFDLSFVAPADAPPIEMVLPAPSARETVEQTIRAADLTTSSAERMSLLTVALNTLETDAASLPSEWSATTRAAVQGQIAKELAIDRRYQAMGARMLRLATARAQEADVRGVQRVLLSVQANDQQLGSARPDVVASVVASVEEQLDAARRRRLALDRWALRAPALRAYRDEMWASVLRLRRIAPMLEDIKALAGSGPDAIGEILRATERNQKVMASVEPPDEMRDIHNMFASAVQLADNAAKIRREAALTGSLQRAWDASSAAAGALMLSSKARADMLVVLQPPQLPR